MGTRDQWADVCGEGDGPYGASERVYVFEIRRKCSVEPPRKGHYGRVGCSDETRGCVCGDHLVVGPWFVE